MISKIRDENDKSYSTVISKMRDENDKASVTNMVHCWQVLSPLARRVMGAWAPYEPLGFGAMMYLAVWCKGRRCGGGTERGVEGGGWRSNGWLGGRNKRAVGLLEAGAQLLLRDAQV